MITNYKEELNQPIIFQLSFISFNSSFSIPQWTLKLLIRCWLTVGAINGVQILVMCHCPNSFRKSRFFTDSFSVTGGGLID